MIGAALAIGDFMLLLLTAILWVVLHVVGWVIAGLVAAGAVFVATRRALRRRH